MAFGRWKSVGVNFLIFPHFFPSQLGTKHTSQKTKRGCVIGIIATLLGKLYLNYCVLLETVFKNRHGCYILRVEVL